MTFCDLSPFYCDTGGGIRTYHRAKIDWFRRQDRHRYVLVVPGRRREVTDLTPHVAIVRVYGVPVAHDRDGYRVPIDFGHIWSVVRRADPDVLEVDDPWISGPLGLLLRRFKVLRGRLASFYHSDPIATYVEPRLGGAGARGPRRLLLRGADRVFYRVQAAYDLTMVTSVTMERRLRAHGVTRIVKVPFGVDQELFDIARPAGRPRDPIRLLYAGRLHNDKDVRVLLDVLPSVLARPDVEVTVAGTGPYRDRFAAWSHPRFTYLGFIRDEEAMREIYAANDVLLAPGRFETFGLAALEAAAAGLIVVGPDEGGTGELLEEMQSPFIFKAGDAASFLAATGRAIDSDRDRMAGQSRALARTYGTWSDAITRQVQACETLAEHAGAPS
jgi:alpha-1,6-mannosyltransferase